LSELFVKHNRFKWWWRQFENRTSGTCRHLWL